MSPRAAYDFGMVSGVTLVVAGAAIKWGLAEALLCAGALLIAATLTAALLGRR